MSCRCSSGIIKRALKEGTENVLSFNFTEVFMDKDIFKKGLESEKIELNDKQEKDFETFSGLLTEWNKKMNLTAVTDPAEISVKHFLDSIVPAFKAEIKENSKIIDVGTGAGFPGVPIKIMRRDLDFTFLDSLNKRITFLNEVSSVLGFEKAEFIHGRAEELGRNLKYREKFDYAVSRAVAPLRILAEYCIPFLKKGGIFIAFKSYDIGEEINDAKPMIGNLGGCIKEICEVGIPCSDIVRRLVVIEKTAATPSAFPRRANKIK